MSCSSAKPKARRATRTGRSLSTSRRISTNAGICCASGGPSGSSGRIPRRRSCAIRRPSRVIWASILEATFTALTVELGFLGCLPSSFVTHPYESVEEYELTLRRPRAGHRDFAASLSRTRRRGCCDAKRRAAGAPRLGLGQCRTAPGLHAAQPVPHVLDHQAVHLRPVVGLLPRPVGAG